MLAGGSYLNDFFAPNPPIILYLYLPPLLLHQMTQLDLILAFRLYVFFLAFLSLTLCRLLMNKIFAKEDGFLEGLFFLALAAVFLLLPCHEFGQRDHLLVVLAFPYLLLAVPRLQHKKLKCMPALFAGILAGLAFAIKPQFLVMPLIIEVYFILRQRHWRAWWRPEVLAITAVLLLHALVLVIFYPVYLQVIAPYILRNYYDSIGYPWKELLFTNLALFCYFPFLVFLLRKKNNPYKDLSAILLLALAGFLFSYFAQRTVFYYHIVPAFSLAILFMTLYFGLFVTQLRRTFFDYLTMSALALIMALFLISGLGSIWASPDFARVAFFVFLGILFTILLNALQIKKSPLKIFWALGSNLFIALLGSLLFAYPAFFSYDIYWQSLDYKEYVLDKLILFMREHPEQHSLYVFSLRVNYSSPLFYYTGTTLAQRFDCFWPVEGFVKQAAQGQGLSLQKAQDQRLFINWVAEDLKRNKPGLVFVDTVATKLLRWDPSFTFLSYLSQNESFREVWKDYHFIGGLEAPYRYRFDVYERNIN